jgi:Domain of unknown function (DUF4422)
MVSNVNRIEQSELCNQRLFDGDKVSLVNEHTAIVPMNLHFNKSVYQQYCEGHNASDYLIVFKLALTDYPEVMKHMAAQFDRTTLYAGNQFILSWPDFDELCRFWFSTLGKFCKIVPWPREDGVKIMM